MDLEEGQQRGGWMVYIKEDIKRVNLTLYQKQADKPDLELPGMKLCKGCHNSIWLERTPLSK